MVHHDAGRTDKQAVNSAVNGRSGPDPLAGPLYGVVITRTGEVIVVSGGRTNHAGLISSVVVSETERDIAPSASARVRRLIDDMSGSPKYVGVCFANNGLGEDYPEAQLDTGARFLAAVCADRGWSANRIVGHAEATRRKIDPSTSMAALRLRVAHLLAGAPIITPPAPVYDYQEATVRTHLVPVGPLDNHGDGRASWDPGFGRPPIPVSAVLQGDNNTAAGYPWSKNKLHPTPSLEPKGTAIVVTVEGAGPGWTVGVYVTVA